MPKSTTKDAEICRQFNELGRTHKLTNEELKLNAEFWRKNPEGCTYCQATTTEPCRPRPNGFGCGRCREMRRPCSKKVNVRVYIIARRKRVGTAYVSSIVDFNAVRTTSRRSNPGNPAFDSEQEDTVESAQNSLVETLKRELEKAKHDKKELKDELQRVQEVHRADRDKMSEAEDRILSLERTVAQGEEMISSAKLEIERLEKTIQDHNFNREVHDVDEVKPAANVEKLRDGLTLLGKFTDTVLASLAQPLVQLKNLDGVLKKKSIAERHILKMMDDKFRALIMEASTVQSEVIALVEDPESFVIDVDE